MGWLERTVSLLFPILIINNPRWKAEWQEQHRTQFVQMAKVAFPLLGLGYLANHYLFDVPMGLEPISFWFQFRLIVSSIFLIAFLCYLSPISRTQAYKLPAILACMVLCHSQALVAIWYGKEAWVFFFGFIVLSVMLLRMTPLMSTLLAFAVILIGAFPLLESGLPSEKLASGAIATFVIVLIIRASYLTDIRNFILNQQNIESQTQISELSREYADRVKSFIPKVIADRLTFLVEHQRMSVVEASITVLKSRKANVSCLFTDIRGFTQGSRDLEGFIAESVIPEVRVCSDTIEELGGIPRKIGDLIFAYFDSDDVNQNVSAALLSAVEISRANESMNATSGPMQISRYILIASGEAMVGNFGGLDSSIEITALGTPVNFLSRLDDITKNPNFRTQAKPGDILLSESSHDLLSQQHKDLPFREIDLVDLEISIRDFPEVTTIYAITPTDALHSTLIERSRALNWALLNAP